MRPKVPAPPRALVILVEAKTRMMIAARVISRSSTHSRRGHHEKARAALDRLRSDWLQTSGESRMETWGVFSAEPLASRPKDWTKKAARAIAPLARTKSPPYCQRRIYFTAQAAARPAPTESSSPISSSSIADRVRASRDQSPLRDGICTARFARGANSKESGRLE